MVRRAILIANGWYDSDQLQNLPTPQGDLEALATVLRQSDLGQFSVVEDRLDRPSWELRRLLQKTLKQAAADDTVLLYFSGHGIREPDRSDGKLFLATSDTDPDIPDATAIKAAEVFGFMERCRARRQLLLLDCCYSGQVLDDLGHKGAAPSLTEEFQHHFGDRQDRDPRRVMAILTASLGRERAFDSPRGGVGGHILRSAFTDAIVEGIYEGSADGDGDGLISFDDLASHVMRQLRNSRQTPEKWSRNSGIIVAGTPGHPLSPVVPPVDSPSPWHSRPASSGAGAPSELRPIEGWVTAFPPPVLRDTPAHVLGVFRPLWTGGEPLSYLGRPTVDDDLRQALRDNRMVVAIGPAAAGKTRSLYEALRQARPDHHVLQPLTASRLHSIVEVLSTGARQVPVVLWLSGLERFLVPGGLDLSTLEDLCERCEQVTVAATMLSSQYQRFENLPAPIEIGQPYAQVLWHQRVRLTPVPAEVEPASLRELAPVYQQRDVGVTLGADLVGLRELLGRWDVLQQEHPLATAIVRAAIDWRRMGMERAISQDELPTIVPYYLESGAPRAIEQHDIREAITRAERQTRSGACLLRRSSGPGAGLVAHSVLLDLSDTESQAVPEGCWKFASRVAGPRQSLIIGFNAYIRQQLNEAWLAWEAAQRGTDPRTSLYLGLLAMHRHNGPRAIEVQTALEQAATSSDPSIATQADLSLARLLRMRQRPAAEVRQAYQHVIARNHRDLSSRARLELGQVLAEHGAYDAAYEQLSKAYEAHEPTIATEAAFQLALLVLDHSDQIALPSHDCAAVARGCLQQVGRSADLRRLYSVKYRLAAFYSQHDDPGSAYELLRSAYAAASAETLPEVAYHLAVLVLDSGDRLDPQVDRAELGRTYLEQARACTDTRIAEASILRLGILSAEAGDGEQAERLFTLAQGSKDLETKATAAYRLGSLLAGQQGRERDAIAALEQALQYDNPSVTCRIREGLSVLYLQRGRTVSQQRSAVTRLDLERAVEHLEFLQTNCRATRDRHADCQLGDLQLELAKLAESVATRSGHLETALGYYGMAGPTSDRLLAAFLAWANVLSSSQSKVQGAAEQGEQVLGTFRAELARFRGHLDGSASLALARELKPLLGTDSADPGLFEAVVDLCDQVDDSPARKQEAQYLAGLLYYQRALLLHPPLGNDTLDASLGEAERRLERALGSELPPASGASFLLGMIAEYRKQVPRAISLYAQVANDRGAASRPEALWRMARLSEARRDFRTARRAYRALAAEPVPYADVADHRSRLRSRLFFRRLAPLRWTDDARADAKRIREQMTDWERSDRLSPSEFIGLLLVAVGVIQLVAYPARFLVAWAPWIGAQLHRHSSAGRFPLLDILIGLAWLAIGQVLKARVGRRLAGWLRVSLFAVLVLGTAITEWLVGGVTSSGFADARSDSLIAGAWAIAGITAIALLLFLPYAFLRRRP